MAQQRQKWVCARISQQDEGRSMKTKEEVFTLTVKGGKGFILFMTGAMLLQTACKVWMTGRSAVVKSNSGASTPSRWQLGC